MTTLRQSFDVSTDGVILEQYRYQAHEDRLYRNTLQPERGRILEHVGAMRREGAIRDLEWGRLAAVVPEQDYRELVVRYPELKAKEADVRTRAWVRLLASSEGRKYTTHETRPGSVRR